MFVAHVLTITVVKKNWQKCFWSVCDADTLFYSRVIGTHNLLNQFMGNTQPPSVNETRKLTTKTESSVRLLGRPSKITQDHPSEVPRFDWLHMISYPNHQLFIHSFVRSFITPHVADNNHIVQYTYKSIQEIKKVHEQKLFYNTVTASVCHTADSLKWKVYSISAMLTNLLLLSFMVRACIEGEKITGSVEPQPLDLALLTLKPAAPFVRLSYRIWSL